MRAKVKVWSVTKVADGETITFGAVTADTEENKVWSKWTPSLTLNITITNPNLIGKYEEGKEYYLDFTEIN